MAADGELPGTAETQGIDYSDFGPHFFVPVPIAPVRDASLFWLNADWFRSQGCDVADDRALRAIERWLLNTFAIRTCDPADPRMTGVARADRYGGIGGTAHGGSGRCVYRGRFNVKGAGRTPLVARNAATHADGSMLLLEAIRGTIYAELTHLETMAGAVRSIAIIRIPPFDVPPEQRRCLLVRPNFIRPAHIERSLLFGTAGFAGSDQFDDHLRVEAVRNEFRTRDIGWEAMTAKAARAIGSLDACRMSQGRFTSSNMSVDGEVADYESFRVLDDWSYTRNVHRDDYPLGKDTQSLIESAASWCRLMTGRRSDIGSVARLVDGAHREGFDETIGRVVPSWRGKRGRERAALQATIHDWFRRSSTLSFTERGTAVFGRCDAESFVEAMTEHASKCGFSQSESLAIAFRTNFWAQPREKLKYRSINAVAHALAASDADVDEACETLTDMLASGRRELGLESDDCAPLFAAGDHGTLIVLDTAGRELHAVPVGAYTTAIRLDRQTRCSADEVHRMAALAGGPFSNRWLRSMLDRADGALACT